MSLIRDHLMKHRVLLVDPSPKLTSILDKKLSESDFSVLVAHDGESGIKKAQNEPLDAIILELVLPKINGLDVLKTIRTHDNIPVIVLTELNCEIDKILSFEFGATDYIVKPCDILELKTRINVAIKNYKNCPVYRSVIKHHSISVDTAKRLVHIAGVTLELTNAEFNILETLIKAPDQAFSKEELTEYALGRKYTAYDRSIDVHISNLRNKLGENPCGNAWIKTVRGFGYSLINP